MTELQGWIPVLVDDITVKSMIMIYAIPVERTSLVLVFRFLFLVLPARGQNILYVHLHSRLDGLRRLRSKLSFSVDRTTPATRSQRFQIMSFIMIISISILQA